MKSFPFYIAKNFTALLAAILTCLSSFAFAAETNQVKILQPGANKFEQWQQLSTDTVKSLRANQLSEAIRLCEQALTLSATFGPTNTYFSRTQILRAEVYLWENKRPQAEEMFKQAVASCEKAASTNSPELIYPLSSQANFYYFVDRHLDRVTKIFERILNLVQNAPEMPTRDRIMWSRNLGKIYQETGQHAKAEPLFKRTIELCEKDDAEWLPYELLNAADFYRDWNKFDQAEALAQRALAIREKALPTGGTDAQGELTTCLANLGATYLAAHKPEKAEANFRRALKILEQITSPDQADLMPPLIGLGDALQQEGKLADAEKMYARTLALAEKNQVTDTRETATFLDKYAIVLTAENKIDEAKKQSERAKAIRAHLEAKTSS